MGTDSRLQLTGPLATPPHICHPIDEILKAASRCCREYLGHLGLAGSPVLVRQPSS